MQAAEAIALVARLADVGGRAEAARKLALAVGAEDMLVFLHDADTDAMIPVAGWRKTLPGGAQWRELLSRSRGDGVHRSDVGWEGRAGHVKAVGCARQGLVIVFVGGAVAEVDATLICSMIPLLKSAFLAQQSLATTSGELQAARSEIRQTGTLMRALDETRSQLDRSLLELDQQARSLEQARSRAEQATRSKDEFMAMLGHELRNPLAPIKTALELLKMRGIWSHEHEVMQRQLSHMIRLVDDLLDVSRIAGGKLMLKLASTEIAVVINRALEIASPLTEQHRQQVLVDVPAKGLCVSGDPARLAQVFANLLTNASKYSDAESRIEVRAVRDGGVVRVCVQDDGIGIEAAMLDDVFALFHQQGRGMDRAQGGLGLGLAIVRNLVALHDGTVKASSPGPGRGSTFTVELPVCAGLPASDAAQSPDSTTASAFAPVRLLLVDDNADARSTLASALTAVGHEVCEAADAFQALEVIDDFQPDVALLDIGLPVMDGYQLADRLRRRIVDGEPLKLLALTGYGQPEDIERTRDAGFVAHFVKPVDFAALLKALEPVQCSNSNVGS